MWFLRQSTASQEIPLGPFLDSTDGNTQETALSIANTDIKVLKAGATAEASKNSGGATHIANGRYYAVLDATDTDTIGPLRVSVHVAGALAVWLDCCVLDEAVFDVLFGTTAPSTHTAAAVQALVAAGAVASVTGAVGSVTGNVGGNVAGSVGSVTGAVGSVTGNVGGNVAGSVGSVAAGGITAASLAADTITAAKIAAGALNGKGDWLLSSGYTAPLDAAGVRSAVGLASANLDTQLAAIAAYIDTEVGAIYTRIGAPAGASIAADLAAVKADTAAVLDDTGSAGVVVAAASKSGYTLTQTFPTNFASLSITAAGVVSADVKKVNAVTLTGDGDGTPWGPA